MNAFFNFYTEDVLWYLCMITPPHFTLQLKDNKHEATEQTVVWLQLTLSSDDIKLESDTVVLRL